MSSPISVIFIFNKMEHLRTTPKMFDNGLMKHFRDVGLDAEDQSNGLPDPRIWHRLIFSMGSSKERSLC